MRRYRARAESKPTLVVAWCDESMKWMASVGCATANFVVYSKCNRTLDAPARALPCVTVHEQNSEAKCCHHLRGHPPSFLT